MTDSGQSLELTAENVDTVLDEIRPHLMAGLQNQSTLQNDFAFSSSSASSLPSDVLCGPITRNLGTSH